MDWITNWSEVDDTKLYIVCYLNSSNGKLHLGQPVGIDLGWKVKRYMSGCYAALECPVFNGIQDTKKEG